MSRDPRVDPRPGDVVQRAGSCIITDTVDHITTTGGIVCAVVFQYPDRDDADYITRSPYEWRGKMRDATILHTAEVPDAE